MNKTSGIILPISYYLKNKSIDLTLKSGKVIGDLQIYVLFNGPEYIQYYGYMKLTLNTLTEEETVDLDDPDIISKNNGKNGIYYPFIHNLTKQFLDRENNIFFNEDSKEGVITIKFVPEKFILTGTSFC